MTARASIRERIDQDLAASIRAWANLAARGLASQTVCKACFGRWRICACGWCHPEDGAQ